MLCSGLLSNKGILREFCRIEIYGNFTYVSLWNVGMVQGIPMENFPFPQILEDCKHEHKPFVKIPLRSQGDITLSLTSSLSYQQTFCFQIPVE